MLHSIHQDGCTKYWRKLVRMRQVVSKSRINSIFFFIYLPIPNPHPRCRSTRFLPIHAASFLASSFLPAPASSFLSVSLAFCEHVRITLIVYLHIVRCLHYHYLFLSFYLSAYTEYKYFGSKTTQSGTLYGK